MTNCVVSRTGSGNEVDFAPVPLTTDGVRTESTPIESKWMSRGWRAEAMGIVGKYGRGAVATKDVIELNGDVWAVPAPMVALLLN